MAHGDLAPQTGLCSADLGRCTRFQGFTSAKRALRMHRIKLVASDNRPQDPATAAIWGRAFRPRHAS